MKIINTEVYGFESAIRAMRNPMNSWDKSDSLTDYDGTVLEIDYIHDNMENFILGDNDKALSQKLTKAGSEHCKHLRLIQVWADIEAPRYWWQEMDTYKHVEKVSCSTMHKLFEKDLTLDNFEDGEHNRAYLVDTIIELNRLRVLSGDENTEMSLASLLKAKTILPESFLQMRTINTNYQQLLNIYNQRKNHRLPQWKVMCEWILSLPYFEELTGIEGDEK